MTLYYKVKDLGEKTYYHYTFHGKGPFSKQDFTGFLQLIKSEGDLLVQHAILVHFLRLNLQQFKPEKILHVQH